MKLVLKGPFGSNERSARRLASRGVRLNWRELLFEEATEFTAQNYPLTITQCQ
jgi:hypothetical protein